MENLISEQLTIEATDGADSPAIVLTWHGQCNDRYPHRILAPYLTRALADAVAGGLPIQMNLARLAYLNSSAITVIVHFLRDAHRQGVPLVLQFNPAVAWQKITCDAVRALGDDDPLLTVLC